MRKKSTDKQVAEFETRDLGDDIVHSASATAVRRRSLPTSILLNEALVAKLKSKARKKGIGYQTLLKIIVSEHVDGY